MTKDVDTTLEGEVVRVDYDPGEPVTWLGPTGEYAVPATVLKVSRRGMIWISYRRHGVSFDKLVAPSALRPGMPAVPKHWW